MKNLFTKTKSQTQTQTQAQSQTQTQTQTQFFNECSICMEAIYNENDEIITPCKHNFHSNCLTNWTKRNNSCPNCRYHLDICCDTYIPPYNDISFSTFYHILDYQQMQNNSTRITGDFNNTQDISFNNDINNNINYNNNINNINNINNNINQFNRTYNLIQLDNFIQANN